MIAPSRRLYKLTDSGPEQSSLSSEAESEATEAPLHRAAKELVGLKALPSVQPATTCTLYVSGGPGGRIPFIHARHEEAFRRR
ncbi:hypothetical protein VFPFJ_04609 [Purpureocillium lilacinum]|uniref:Uncharacterized protein n=1 Tax=Purpureocillium lilacinum TaxID=33203 RepID=A0A179HLV0_PURLI|nr:hypothetical protein VFPFJ_04609 [Purpureocillium lilacinum]OAQ90449.1 hypothetical protein VFPFJ_04609 [Purpureocillium lilacinum]